MAAYKVAYMNSPTQSPGRIKAPAKARTERVHLAENESVQIDLDVDLKIGKDGSYRFALVIETSLGTIFLKGFRVDHLLTDVMMPVLPMGTYTSPFYLAGMSAAVKSAVVDKLKEMKGKGVLL
jgi:hypothetical protein